MQQNSTAVTGYVPHLRAMVLAVGLLLAILASGAVYLQWFSTQYIHSLAPAMFSLKNQGSELQAEALQQSDLLVVYGSSELEFANPYHANVVFQSYPDGFTIFPVGRGNATSLVMLQDVAAAGSQLRGNARLRDVAARYSVPVVDFADHDDDIYFVTDPNSHLSRKGWVFYDQALDAFFHDRLGVLAAAEWSASAVTPASLR